MQLYQVVDLRQCNNVELELPYRSYKSIESCFNTEDKPDFNAGHRLTTLDLLMLLKYFRDRNEIEHTYQVAMMLYWTADGNEYHEFVIQKVTR